MTLLWGIGMVLVGTLSGIGIAHAGTPSPHIHSCDRGTFCFWNATGYRGDSRFLDLRTAAPGDCPAVTDAFPASSFANRSGRTLTVYADTECLTCGHHLSY